MMWKLLVCITVLSVAASKDVGMNGEYLQSFLTKFFQKNYGRIGDILPAFGNFSTKQQVAVINDYVDELLEELNVFVVKQRLDPVEMPNIKNDFEWKIMFITYTGKLYMTDGWLQGLGTMQRHEDATVWYEYPNLKIRLPLGYDVLMFDYKYVAKFMKLGPSGNVDGKSINSKFTIEVEINMITLKAKLVNFTMDTVGKIYMKFTGKFLTSLMANIFSAVTIPLMKPVINVIVESFVAGGLVDVINFYNGVICNILENC